MVAVVIVLMVHSAVNGIRTEEINAESGEVELRVSEYFTKYKIGRRLWRQSVLTQF